MAGFLLLSLEIVPFIIHLLFALICLPSIFFFLFSAPPKVTNLKLVGELREGNKLSVTATVTGGSEGSSRVQWFKTSSSRLEGEHGLEALSTSKIAKVGNLTFSIHFCSSLN